MYRGAFGSETMFFLSSLKKKKKPFQTFGKNVMLLGNCLAFFFVVEQH